MAPQEYFATSKWGSCMRILGDCISDYLVSTEQYAASLSTTLDMRLYDACPALDVKCSSGCGRRPGPCGCGSHMPGAARRWPPGAFGAQARQGWCQRLADAVVAAGCCRCTGCILYAAAEHARGAFALPCVFSAKRSCLNMLLWQSLWSCAESAESWCACMACNAAPGHPGPDPYSGP